MEKLGQVGTDSSCEHADTLEHRLFGGRLFPATEVNMIQKVDKNKIANPLFSRPALICAMMGSRKGFMSLPTAVAT